MQTGLEMNQSRPLPPSFHTDISVPLEQVRLKAPSGRRPLRYGSWVLGYGTCNGAFDSDWHKRRGLFHL